MIGFIEYGAFQPPTYHLFHNNNIVYDYDRCTVCYTCTAAINSNLELQLNLEQGLMDFSTFLRRRRCATRLRKAAHNQLLLCIDRRVRLLSFFQLG